MTAKSNYWKLGFFVLVGAGLGLAAIIWVGTVRLARETIDFYAYFDEPVSGLEEGSSVKFRGVNIGRIASIEAAPDRRHVEVRAEVFTASLERLGLRIPERRGDRADFMPADLRVQLVTSILTGITFVQSDFVDIKKYPAPDYPFAVPWNTVDSIPSAHKSLEIGLTRIIDGLPPVLEQAERFLTRSSRALDEARVDVLSQRIESLLGATEAEVARIARSGIVESSAQTLAEARQGVGEIRALAADLRTKEGPLHRVADRFEALGSRIEAAVAGADVPATAETLRQTGRALAGVAGELQGLGRDLRREFSGLTETLAAVRRLADLIDRDPGALLRGRAPADGDPRARSGK